MVHIKQYQRKKTWMIRDLSIGEDIRGNTVIFVETRHLSRINGEYAFDIPIYGFFRIIDGGKQTTKWGFSGDGKIKIR